MTVPRGVRATTTRVSDFVRSLIPQMRSRVSREEAALAGHIRGNEPLYNALRDLILARLGGRQNSPVPSDALACLATMSRDNELRWFLSSLERAYRTPPLQPDDDGEQPG